MSPGDGLETARRKGSKQRAPGSRAHGGEGLSAKRYLQREGIRGATRLPVFVTRQAFWELAALGDRDRKMGQARRAGPPARQKQHGPGLKIQPANPIQPDPSSLLAYRANP